MVNLGRPVSLSREIVAKACLNTYWTNGINNISYNDVIKASKLSKGSIYKLFNNEDDLQAETINYYIKSNNLIFDQISNAKDLFQLMKTMSNWKFSNNMKYCFFFISCTEKYKVGKKTRAKINKIENKVKKILNEIVKKHIKKYNIKKNKIESIKLVNYLFNNFTFIMLSYRNKLSNSEINTHKENLHILINNISNNRNNFVLN